MKIAMVSDWFPPKVGGVESVVYNLSKELASREGIEVDVLTSNYPKTFTFNDKVEEMEGFTVRRLSGVVFPEKFRYIYFHPELPFKLKKLFKEQDYDVVHTHHLFTPLSILTSGIAKSMHPMRECVVMTNHTYHGFSENPLFRLINFISQRPANPDLVTVVSSAAKKLVNEMDIDMDKVRVVPNGVDIDEFNPNKFSTDVRDEIGEGSDILVLFVGRFIERKGLQCLIPAFKEAEKEFDGSMKLAIVGEGPMESEIRNLVSKLDIKDSVKFLRGIKFETLQKLYATCDFVTIPTTKNESFGLVLMEAIASGKPIITTDIRGYREVFNEGTGFMIDPCNKKSLKEKIVQLAENKDLREKMSKKARKVAVEKYSWNEVVDQFLEVYNEALS